MTSNSLLTLLAAAVFSLSFATLGYSTAVDKSGSGVISKIEGNTITVVDSKGKEGAIVVKDQEALKELKIGDRVALNEDTVAKESSESPATQKQ